MGGPKDADSCGLVWQAWPCPRTGEVNVNGGGGSPGFSVVKEKTVQGVLGTWWLNLMAGVVLSSLPPQKGHVKKW